jgi:hypothetical protein
MNKAVTVVENDWWRCEFAAVDLAALPHEM